MLSTLMAVRTIVQSLLLAEVLWMKITPWKQKGEVTVADAMEE
jgi:hypothetical protein